MSENILKRLKYILNSYTDKELEEIDLWIDNTNTVDVIAVDSNSISLITDDSLLKIDGRQW
ncbi:MAG: hypothetical protein K1W33_07045 [Clostridia bacterium]